VDVSIKQSTKLCFSQSTHNFIKHDAYTDRQMTQNNWTVATNILRILSIQDALTQATLLRLTDCCTVFE